MSRATRVLVTGAAGFIGSSLTDRLLAEGDIYLQGIMSRRMQTAGAGD